MRIFWKRWISLPVFGVVCAISAATAGAGGISSLPSPDVFSGEFGIVLAKGQADALSVLDGIENIAGESFPWTGGFEFSLTLPTLPTNQLPDDLPPNAQAGANVNFSGAAASRAPVPEPEPAILIALGLVSLGMLRRRRSA